jgi:hypothetical protein
MNLYGVALLPLLKRMHEAVPHVLAPTYMDDTAAAGKAVHNAACLSYLLHHGPRHGYFPDPGKSWYICKVEDEAVPQQAFEANDLDIQQYSHGQRYFGWLHWEQCKQNRLAWQHGEHVGCRSGNAGPPGR